ncbi:hypothetical protein NKH18_37515 [Streptomyces sp. M10(2022)]
MPALRHTHSPDRSGQPAHVLVPGLPIGPRPLVDDPSGPVVRSRHDPQGVRPHRPLRVRDGCGKRHRPGERRPARGSRSHGPLRGPRRKGTPGDRRAHHRGGRFGTQLPSRRNGP